MPPLPISGTIKSYVFQPLLWGLLIWVMVKLPKYQVAGKLGAKSALIQVAFVIGFFQVVLYVIGGLFSGFGKSPYVFTPLGILINVVYAGSRLVGMEMSRAWLVNRLGREHTVLAVAFVGFIYALTAIPLAQISGLRPTMQSISLLNSTLLPGLTESLLATLLALLAGPLAALAYRGTLEAFWWFCPILPDLTWVFKGLIGTAVPMLGLAVVNTSSSFRVRGSKVKLEKQGSLGGWVVTSVFSVAIIWFSVGLFPVHPALVASGSMRPEMDVGDTVIVAKVKAETIKLGDVIEFRTKEKINVMHRVIRTEETEQGAKVFITKGDANREPDTEPVNPNDVRGRVIFTIPKVGWLAVVLKGFFSH